MPSLADIIFYLGDKNGEDAKIGALIPCKKMIKNGKRKRCFSFSYVLHHYFMYRKYIEIYRSFSPQITI